MPVLLMPWHGPPTPLLRLAVISVLWHMGGKVEYSSNLITQETMMNMNLQMLSAVQVGRVWWSAALIGEFEHYYLEANFVF